MKRANRPTLILLLLIPLVLVSISLFSLKPVPFSHNVEATLSSFLSQNLPFSRPLKQLGFLLRYKAGETKQQGIFISPNGLLKDMPPPNEAVVKGNNRRLLDLGESTREEGFPTSLMLIPSGSAIVQQSLPRFSSPTNQRNIIDNVYNQMSGAISTIHLYNSLLEQKSKYLYYRTEDNLTPLGGYYVYNEALRRLMPGASALPLSQFQVLYGAPFYGALYDQIPYAKIKPDAPLYYTYQGIPRSYKVQHYVNRYKTVYHSLYSELAEGAPYRDAYLGGGTGYLTITTSATNSLHLLVLGDDTGIAYLPFLANHYGKITFINLASDPPNLNRFSLEAYNQVLVAVSVETYTSTPLLQDWLGNNA